jgi:acetyl-CoA synthase
MSKIIASAAILGAHKIVDQAEIAWKQAVDKYGLNGPVGFPNTAYYLPVIYGILGLKVDKLIDIEKIIKKCRQILPTPVKAEHHLPYLAPALDAGMAALWAEEIIEAIRYLEHPDYYLKGEDISEDNLWLGAADDVILRKRGVEFVDGTAPGFAAILGAAPSIEIAARIAVELQQKNLYAFMSASSGGKRFSEQLVQAGIQIGWPTRLVSFGPDVSSTVFALGFATRAALSFGGIQPGEFKKILLYNKDRIFAFVLPMGFVNDEWYATAAGAINFGFPVIADTPIPEILPTGICTYEHVVSNVPHDNLVTRAIEVRGLKINVASVPIPVAYGAAFEGERVRGEDIFLECGGGRTTMLEWVSTHPINEVEDGKIEVIGTELTEIPPNSRLPMAICVEVAGREMHEDFEPILERQIHHLINYAQGVMHIGQRDIAWLRISNQAVEKGFKIRDLGVILHSRLHQDFGRIFDKLQVKIYTGEPEVKKRLELARAVYQLRDARIEGMTDENTDTFYSCTLCQSFAPSHVCVISPERTGLCGSYNWMDCKASFEINPTGPNQPVPKGEAIDARLGQWKGINTFITKASRGKIDHYNLYSIMCDPMTTCGCCECIAAVLPLCNGIMTVNRDYNGMTPSGMKFTTLAGTIGGGLSTPGFLGHGKYNTTQRKFCQADGGLLRIVWMPRILKEEIRERLIKRAAEMGVPDLLDKIADETIGTTEETILPFLTEKNHPALNLTPIIT